MKERIFTYHYDSEGEQYAFYRIHKALIANPYSKHLSTDAKLLYGLMLDCLSLSMKKIGSMKETGCISKRIFARG